MQYVIGVDVGTSGTKTVLFDKEGNAVAHSTIEYPMYQPQNGWAEQDAQDFWEASVGTIKDVISKSGVNPSDIAGLGISGQMHGLVMLDEKGDVLRRCIIWCDGRTIDECREITALVGEKRLIEITANPALTGFTAGKILWVRKHEPKIYAKCRYMLLPKDYIRYKLTGAVATEVSDASGMNLLDVAGRCWSKEVLEKLDIDENLLGKMNESCEVTGEVSEEAAKLTGLKPGTPVVGGAGDNAAAAVGTGVVENGRAFVTIGTSGVIFAHTDKMVIDPEGRVHTFCAAVPGAYTVMSCTLSAGGSLQWFRNNFCESEMAVAKNLGVDPYELMTSQAEKSPIGANRLLFLPYLMGERSPLLDPYARGVFFGLSGIHTKQDVLRSIMEGVAFSQRECLDIIEEMGVTFSEMLATGGGGRSVFLRQMLSDNLGYPVKTIQNQEGAALGVAILAAVGAGLYKSVPEACQNILKFNEPQIPQNRDKYTPSFELYKRLYRSLKGEFQALRT